MERLEFIKKAKRLGLSLDEIRDILEIRALSQAPCVHVMSLLDQKLEQVDGVIRQLEEFRRELQRLNTESKELPDQPLDQPCICGIIEKGINADGQAAMAWMKGPGHLGRSQASFACRDWSSWVIWIPDSQAFLRHSLDSVHLSPKVGTSGTVTLL